MYRHDTLWKGLLQAFFPDFLTVVAPEVADHLDMSSPTFLEQETFTDPPEGEKALLDLLAKVPSREGPVQVVLIHVEVEREFRRTMDLRMWRYFAHLSLKYPHAILPIVLFLRGGEGGVGRRQVQHRVGDAIVNAFSYWTLGLSRSTVDAMLDFGPLGVALASCVRQDLPKDEQKFRCVSALASSDVDPAQRHLLLTAVNTYLSLNKDEKMKYAERVAESVSQPEIRKMELTWAGKLEQKHRRKYTKLGRQEGVELGRQEGVEAGRCAVGRRLLLKIVATRFGQPSATFADQVHDLDDPDRLELLCDRALVAPELAEVEALLDRD
ncbi:MAG: hypothetical protein AAFY88_13515 [Acidobacteriota bacterium]